MNNLESCLILKGQSELYIVKDFYEKYFYKMKIRPIEIQDKDLFWEMINANKKHLQQYFPITLNQLPNRDSTDAFIKKKIIRRNQKEGYYFVMEDALKIVGVISAKSLDWSVPKCEIAYFIDQNYQGQGWASNAVKWMTNFCFTDLKMVRVYARINPGNVASKKVLLKNKYEFEGLMKNDYRDGNGNLTDTEYYACIK